MRASARNRLPGVVVDVKVEGLMAQVELKVGDNHVVALISAEAARELDLKVGRPGGGHGEGHVGDGHPARATERCCSRDVDRGARRTRRAPYP